MSEPGAAPPGYEQRLAALEQRLAELPGAVVAFSGGVDSAMLLFACRQALGPRVLAVTADSPSLPRDELASAEEFCRAHDITHRVVATRELEREGYRTNASDRCYHCKSELFDSIAAQVGEAGERGWPVLFGAIADDLTDHRPGARAASERGVLAPLAEAGLSKRDVRHYSSSHGLPTADKPSLACLASRVPYGTPVSAELLAKLERAESALRALGYRQLRVRHHGPVARIEVSPEDLPRAVTIDRERIVQGVRAAGYTYVSLDLVGYRSGAMNEVLR
ncbi:MAG: ATP-dependent sacrificial sulfur transferase LarE [Planctomycetes bacterium]|nr:ATP-dependent sacrificial sulfur transferase LarE [Planctomycetota bacterium]MCB9870935.1 ATP-dependent sacrificial sulfur transferase LarE [Planctomycetota bacterium]MCB9888299.1 ATP-dependent sacrificial sulfur transferase LarE [Planctomycetota bacterium]